MRWVSECVTKLAQSTQAKETEKKSKKGLFSFFSSKKSDTELSQEELEFIAGIEEEDALDQDKEGIIKNEIFLKANFKMASFALQLSINDNTIMLQYTMLQSNLIKANNSLEVSAEIGSQTIAISNGTVNSIVSSKIDQLNNLLTIKFKKNPPHSKSVSSISVEIVNNLSETNQNPIPP